MIVCKSKSIATFAGVNKIDKDMNTMLIELTNQRATGLLYELEELSLIKILSGKTSTVNTRLSDKYKGILTREEGEQLNQHIKEMRNEWNNI